MAAFIPMARRTGKCFGSNRSTDLGEYEGAGPERDNQGTSLKTATQELTLSSALSDPLVRTLMSADNVDPGKLESMLRRIAEELKPRLSTEGHDRDKCRPPECSMAGSG
jgi:hypothetical protein